jgi:hypothetical protein
MSFTGSSVTAGHDSLLSEAFPALVYDTMGPAFRALGVELVARNVAVGNNPCMPYDACLKVSDDEAGCDKLVAFTVALVFVRLIIIHMFVFTVTNFARMGAY